MPTANGLGLACYLGARLSTRCSSQDSKAVVASAFVARLHCRLAVAVIRPKMYFCFSENKATLRKTSAGQGGIYAIDIDYVDSADVGRRIDGGGVDRSGGPCSVHQPTRNRERKWHPLGNADRWAGGACRRRRERHVSCPL